MADRSWCGISRRRKFTGSYRFCPSFAHPGRGRGASGPRLNMKMGVGMSGRIASPSKRTIFPTLRFRAKIILGFAAVLVISAGSMAFAYFGFERVASGVGSYRTSVTEADLARNASTASCSRPLQSCGRQIFRRDRQGRRCQGMALPMPKASLKNAIDRRPRPRSVQTQRGEEGLDNLAKEFANF